MENTFLKDAIRQIASMAAPTIRETSDGLYADKPMMKFYEKPAEPEQLHLDTLTGLVKAILFEPCSDDNAQRLLVHVIDQCSVHVMSELWDARRRYHYYTALSMVPQATFGQWMDHERAIIELRTLYAPTPDREYLLDLLSSMDLQQGVKTTDNGVTQEVVAKRGVVLKESICVKPIVRLKPYRTFLEVDQPESEFLLRVNGEGQVALYEADAGAWKLEAKRNIAAWLEDKLSAEIESGGLIVLI